MAHNLAIDLTQAAERKKVEQKETARMSRRISKRQAIGNDWDGKDGSVNLGWPLATALIREGNKELLKAAMFYRKIEAQANSEPMIGGGGVVDMKDVTLDGRSYVRKNGDVAYSGIRESKASDAKVNCGTRVSKADDKTHPDDIKAPIKTSWGGANAIEAKIDAQKIYRVFVSRLGVILPPFEQMVCDGMTYEEAGRNMGVAGVSQARAAARTIAHMGLVSIRDGMGKVSRADLVH